VLPSTENIGTTPAIPLTEKELSDRLAPISGFLRDHEAYLLYRIARSLSASSSAAEIGSWMGRSSVAIALGLSAPGAILHTIDDHRGITGHEGEQPSEPILRQFLQNLKQAGVSERVQHHPVSSHDLAASWRVALDFLFIDGDHRYDAVKKDLLYASHLKPGAWIAFHDSGNPEVAQAIGEWWDGHRIAPVALARAGTILALRLPGPKLTSLPPAVLRQGRKGFYWAACEIPPKSKPVQKLVTKWRQSQARAFFREQAKCAFEGSSG
jgi:predicted O-methyltransferase YrrM